MRMLVWALRALVFLVLFGFAVKNTDSVSLNFFFGAVWRAPLVLLLFGFFAAGVLLTLMAVSGGFIRQRRELSRLRANTAAPRGDEP